MPTEVFLRLSKEKQAKIREAIRQEFARVPDEYCLKLGSGSPPKTRAKYLKAQENKKK